MTTELSIGEAAKRLGIEPDTLRRIARKGLIESTRTCGGHRRFSEAAVAEYCERRRQTKSTTQRKSKIIGRTPAAHLRPSGPSKQEVDPVFALDDLVEPSGELDSSQRYSNAPQLLPSLDDRTRLEGIKRTAILAIPFDTPALWRARIIADLEDFVTFRQFPARLSPFEASSIAQARVEQVLTPYRERQEAEKARKAAEQKAEWRVAALRSHGNGYAIRETTGWDWSAQSEARRDASRELDAKVKSDWSERDVERLVDDVLDDWVDEDDEDSEFDDGD